MLWLMLEILSGSELLLTNNNGFVSTVFALTFKFIPDVKLASLKAVKYSLLSLFESVLFSSIPVKSLKSFRKNPFSKTTS